MRGNFLNRVSKSVGYGCASFLAMLLLSSTAFAEVAMEELEDLSASGLLGVAEEMLSDANYDDATVYMEAYLDRMWGMDDSRVLAMSQSVRLKLGKIKVYQQDTEEAVRLFSEYMESLPRYKPREALKLLALNLYQLAEYELAITTITNALTQPEPVGLKNEKKKVVYEELSKDELGGMTARQLKRYDKMQEESGDDLQEGFSQKVPDPEPPYPIEDLVILNLALAQSYTALDDWRSCLKPYQFIIDNSPDESRVGYAIMEMVAALVKLEEFDEASVFVEKLYRTNARYDIRVNLALMNVANSFFNAHKNDSALKLYRMILPRDVLVAYQEKKMNQIARDAGLPDIEMTVVTNDAGRIDTAFGYKYVDVQTKFSALGSTSGLPPKPPKLERLEELIRALLALAPYEESVRYQLAQLYAKAGRPWEAATAFEMVADHDPKGKRGQRAFAEYLLVLTDPLEKYERVERLGKDYLDNNMEGLGPRMVAHALTSCYQKQEHWKDVKTLIPYLKGFVPAQNKIIRKYECELYYMQAIADIVLLNYADAKISFAKLMEDYPQSHQHENATYWHAMAQVFLKEHQVAFDEFTAYLETYPKGKWLASIAFYRGICLFGLEKYDEAEAQFGIVIDNYPKSSVYCDALSLRADLLAARGLLDEAQRDYEQAIASATEPRHATYAVFQMAAMFELEERYDEVLDVVYTYLDRYEEKADVAKAAYWIGKTKIALNKTDEAVEAYRETIIDYGHIVLQDGVDLIITELVNLSKQRLEDDQIAALKQSLLTSLEESDNLTLQLRLRVLLASMEDKQIELGMTLIEELKDLELAPPPVLGVICDASFEMEDYSRAEELLNLFQTRYEESDFIRAALKLRGFELFNKEEYVKALELANEAQAIYGTDPSVAWAQIMKGRIELKTGNFVEARKTFESVITVRDWRGEPYAEATYYLGRVEEESGDSRTAFGWYQRVYFLYKGYAKGYWAAEGYLASARCLLDLGLENDRRNTYRAMLFDRYVNTLPQAEEARVALGAEEVIEIRQMISAGVQTNVTVHVAAKGDTEPMTNETKSVDAEVAE